MNKRMNETVINGCHDNKRNPQLSALVEVATFFVTRKEIVGNETEVMRR
jgi:hypothetical protein